MNTNGIQTPCADVHWDGQQNILYVRFLRATNLAGIKEHSNLITSYLHSIQVEQPVLIMSDASQLTHSVPKENRDYLASQSGDLCKGAALLVGSIVSKIAGNLVLKFSKPVFPTKIFTDETKAIAWLKTFTS